MTPIDYSKLERSLRRLMEQHDNYLAADETLPRLDCEARAESVIQRFETCYDCLWKVLKRYLTQDLGLADLPNSPRPLFRIAAENRMLDSPVEQWLRYVEARVDTTHDYDGEKAKACLELVSGFIADAVSVYEAMTGDPWE